MELGAEGEAQLAMDVRRAAAEVRQRDQASGVELCRRLREKQARAVAAAGVEPQGTQAE